MRRYLALLLAVLPAAAQQTEVRLDKDNTQVRFVLGDVLHTVHGMFKLSKGELWFDPATGKADGLLVVNAASGESGSHARDSRMNNNILESSIYPEITFAPDRIDGKVNTSGQSEFGLHGTFTIHGVGHELTMHVKADIESNRVSATATFDVPYVKWGLKNPSTLFLRVNETVPIEIQTVGVTNPK